MQASPVLDDIFIIPACARFMLVHESGGITWFNKERFEELILWLYIIKLCDVAAQKPAARTLSAWCGASGRELQRLAELAAHAGYRTALFQNLIAPVTENVSKKERKGKSAIGLAKL
jgi:hypothetical protein